MATYTPEEQSLKEAYYSKPTVGVVNYGGMTPEQYYASLLSSTSGQAGSIQDMIRQAMTQGTQQINEASIPERTRAMEEARMLGKSYAGVNRLDEQKQKNIAEMISSLMGKQAGLLSDAYGQIPQQQLAGMQMFGQQGLQGQELGLRERSGLSGLLENFYERKQQGSQFGMSQGLEREKMAQDLGLTKQKLAWDREKTGAQLRAQADASESSLLDKIGKGTQIASNLMSGFGQIGEGYGSYLSGKSNKNK